MELAARTKADRRGRGLPWSAFTLLELMIVVVLIGITSAMILPEMRGTMEEMVLRSSARELVSACGVASSQAITVGQVHRLRLDPATRRYALERASAAESGQAGFAKIDHLPGSRGQLDRRITMTIRKSDELEPADDLPLARNDSNAASPGEVIAFYPDGTADTGEIVLRDGKGFALSLRINTTTGRVRVAEVESE
jgi:general secretion pathway protein H